jgi:hypothetical protein
VRKKACEGARPLETTSPIFNFLLSSIREAEMRVIYPAILTGMALVGLGAFNLTSKEPAVRRLPVALPGEIVQRMPTVLGFEASFSALDGEFRAVTLEPKVQNLVSPERFLRSSIIRAERMSDPECPQPLRQPASGVRSHCPQPKSPRMWGMWLTL